MLFFALVLLSSVFPLWAMETSKNLNSDVENLNALMQKFERLEDARELIELLQEPDTTEITIYKQLTKLELEAISALNSRRLAIRESTSKQLSSNLKDLLQIKKNRLQKILHGEDATLIFHCHRHDPELF